MTEVSRCVPITAGVKNTFDSCFFAISISPAKVSNMVLNIFLGIRIDFEVLLLCQT